MVEIKLDKKDVIWSYLAQFLSIGTGIITLPFILNKLSAEEIGFNYILITVGSVITLVDLGFAPQFARNFTYIFSGAQELKKEGIGKVGKGINYHLLAYLLKTARYIYGLLAVLALILLLIIGTPYVYRTTNEFTAVPNALEVWVIYSFGILFQVFYSYYFSMLLGAGKIKEQKYALIGNKLTYIIILISGLYFGFGLLSVAVAQFVSPFFGRIVSYHYFYSPSLRTILSTYKTTEREKIIYIFKTLWYNAKRTAIMQIGAYAILRFSMFIAGLYLSLSEFASYGLMVQLVGICGTISVTYMQISQPKFSSLRAKGEDTRLLTNFSVALLVFYVLFILGSMIIILWGQAILNLIHANAELPSKVILLIYCIVMFLEFNHSNFAGLISTDNKVPFAPASISTGLAVCFGIFIVVRYSNLGIIGLVLVQGICQAVYQNWRWPQLALHNFQISFFYLIKLGITEIKKIIYA